MTPEKEETMEQIPPELQHVVDEAKRNPYEAFASAAVALLSHDQRQQAEENHRA